MPMPSKKEAFFANRMIRIGDQSGEIIQEHRLGFLESHTVFAPVLRIPGFVPFELRFVHDA